MENLYKINEVAARYHITSRTLRYYEEIGILKSTRDRNSNYRYYDNASLHRLEQILLLKSLKFQISEICQILLSEDDKLTDKLFREKLHTLQSEIESLTAYKQMIASIIKLKESHGISTIGLDELLAEQIYINKEFERVFEMNENVQDAIMLEFGYSAVCCGNNLIPRVKEMRTILEPELGTSFPLIRVKDNLELKEDEFRVLIKGIVIENDTLENLSGDEKVDKMVDALKRAITNNISNLS